MSHENVHHYGQLRLEEKDGWYHVYHRGNRLNDKGLLDLSRAYAWAKANHEELTLPPPEKKQPEWGDDGFDYHNYYASGQP